MKRSTQFLAALGFAAAAMAVVPACTLTAQGPAPVGAFVVYDEPPQPRIEQVAVRPGSVWVKGHWDWRAGQWQWTNGHWENERAGYRWEEGQWTRDGKSWRWIDGRWVGVAGYQPPVAVIVAPVNNSGGATVSQPYVAPPPAVVTSVEPSTGIVTRDHRDQQTPVVVVAQPAGEYPTKAPPPLQVENPGSRGSNFVWAQGRWEWRAGNWAWVGGHWERRKANQTWVNGRWELQGSKYVWVEGGWR